MELLKLVERDAPLAELLRLRDEASAGHGRLVLLGGEAGIGKTSIATALLRDCSKSMRVFTGACDALSTPRPLAPLLDVGATMRGELARLLREAAPVDQVCAALLADLRASERPSFVLFEDAHWADAATIDALRFLGRRVGSLRVLIVVTFRDDEVGPRHPLRVAMGDMATAASVRRMILSPLSVDGVRVLAGKDIDAEALHARTRGNPFFVVETIAAGALLSESVRDAVLARASRLGDAARQTLETAAVIGHRVEAALLEALRRDALAADDCVSARMLDADEGAFVFRHELVRDAILSALPSDRRRAIHAAALAVLRARPERPDDLATLAHHAEGANDVAATRTYAVAAARHAARLGAHREAAAQYARALRAAGDAPDPERAELLEARSYECYLTDQMEEAIATRKEALAIRERLGDALRFGDDLRWLSRFSWYGGHTADARAYATRAIAALEPLEPTRELAAAYSNASQLAMNGFDEEQTIGFGEKALALARQFEDVAIEVHALNNMGTVVASVRDDEVARDRLRRSLELAQKHNLEEHAARAFTNLAYHAVAQRRFRDGETYLTDGIVYCSDRSLDSWTFYMQGVRAQMALLRGDLVAAADEASAVLAQPRLSAISKVTPLSVLGTVRALRGDPEVWPVLDQAMAIAEPMGEVQRVAPPRIARALAAWVAGDDERARAEALAVLPRAAKFPWVAGEMATWARRAGATVDVPALYRARASELEATFADVDLGTEASLRVAHAAFERMGARGASARVARMLRELGARSIPRGPRPSTRDNTAGLTTRELEILGGLAQGLGNPEIAKTLHVSRRTVDHHVSAILAKLGAKNRTDAARMAAERGIVLPKIGKPGPQNR